MQVACILHLSIAPGTPMKEVREAVEKAIVLDIDNENGYGTCIEAAEISLSSLEEYDPEYGSPVVYQP